MSEPELYHALLLLLFAISGVVFAVLGLVTAPYGRHGRRGWGPAVPERLGWVIMEAPASLDRTVAISSNHFRAADAGQMSLFGAATGIIEEITLPEVKDVDKREVLNWERELIGLYISDHPLNEYQATLAKIVSYFSGQLGEANHEEKVRMAGLITGVRPYTTKTGKPMGFAALEDIQGTVELVLFPKTWEAWRE